jgi:hypothetical protein
MQPATADGARGSGGGEHVKLAKARAHAAPVVAIVIGCSLLSGLDLVGSLDRVADYYHGAGLWLRHGLSNI